MRISDAPIAFFDSGIGGLTVLAECVKRIKTGNFYYFGDNGNAPYGNLSVKRIEELVFAAFERFEKEGVKAAVLACNTATAVCAEKLRQKYTFPIVGAEPAVFLAAKEGGEVYVLSTRATFESERFCALIHRAGEKYPQANIRPFACEALAGAIENASELESFSVSSFLPNGTPQSVVLGCTHYIYVKEQIQTFYGCKTVDGNEGIAKRLASFLELPTTPAHLYPEEAKKPQITFLGNSAKQNEQRFKQMFGLKA
ncbi:MAG: glutamate racemase [Clostridia bacterium]|nr:glutamate racemase [Clostridia bacterium]